jgi:hypothetical protein
MPGAPETVYCSIFDAAYVARALTLHASLLEANPHSHFAFMCLDDQSAQLLDELAPERATVVPYPRFGSAALDQVRASRSRGEFSWTCKPFALQYLARAMPGAAWLAYVDADAMFYGDPDTALPGPQLHYVLTPHRFHPVFSAYGPTAGRFNAGYLAMRNTPEGRRAIEWWGERCLESCSSTVTDVTYADQRYLDQMPGLFPYGDESAHPGLNAAPWNIGNYSVTGAGRDVRLDGQPLLLYHFQALRLLNTWLVDLYAGELRFDAAVRGLVYEPYLVRLTQAHALLHARFGARAPAAEPLLRSVRDWARLARGVANGKHNLVLRRVAP